MPHALQCSNERVASVVGTREGYGCGICASSASDVDLSALHLNRGRRKRGWINKRQGTQQTVSYVELSARIRCCRVESNDLGTKEVIARSNASRNFEVDEAFVGNQCINRPSPIRVKTVFIDLEPIETSHSGREG